MRCLYKPHSNHKGKPIIDTQMRKRKESKHTTTKSQQFTKMAREEERKKELQNCQKTINKMIIVNS